MCFLDRNKPLEIHDSRDLPHWNQNGVIQFVTFRLADSLPQSKIAELKELKERFESQHPKPWTPEIAIQYAKLIGPIQNELLDKGYGICVLKRQDAREILSSAISFFDGQRYEVLAFVIMPNHVHLLIHIFDGYKLENIMHSIKSFSAQQINKLLNTTGKLWLKENWDRIVRSEKHLMHCIEYIKGNPRNLKEGEYMLYLEELTAFSGPSTEPTAGSGPSTKLTAGSGPSTLPTASSGPSTELTAGSGPSTALTAGSSPSTESTAGSSPSSKLTAGSSPSTLPTAGSSPSTKPTAGSGPSTELTAGCGPSTLPTAGSSPHLAVTGMDGPLPAVTSVDGPHPAVTGVDGPLPAVTGVAGPHLPAAN